MKPNEVKLVFKRSHILKQNLHLKAAGLFKDM